MGVRHEWTDAATAESNVYRAGEHIAGTRVDETLAVVIASGDGDGVVIQGEPIELVRFLIGTIDLVLEAIA